MLPGFMTIGFCQENESAMVVDGRLSEWGVPLRYYNLEAEVSYDIRNDDEAFYVVLHADNPQSVHRLLSGGFKIAFDGKGRKKTGLSLKYEPTNFQPQAPDSTKAGKGMGFRPGGKQGVSGTMLENSKCTTKGFTGLDDGTYSLKGLEPLSVAVAMDSATGFVFEIRMPFTALGYTLKAKEVTVGILLPAISGNVPRMGAGGSEMPPSGDRPPGDFQGRPQGPPPGGGGPPPQGMPSDAGLGGAGGEITIWKSYLPGSNQ